MLFIINHVGLVGFFLLESCIIKIRLGLRLLLLLC